MASSDASVTRTPGKPQLSPPVPKMKSQCVQLHDIINHSTLTSWTFALRITGMLCML